ncbi:hypothetical protein MXL46_18950 [Heyndrickxia sporothermodurans]|uniref:hypothetical protein n=1 Tax=Heyndrickxia sporothermodurans TaxID=46224 RepID=UPI002DB7CD82|nr:hypothetical protein [Heyndrickxia sporothermodurans]MEB6551127.1 hypothetical protein [Heyndrickxia sporothermodurans]
MSLANYNKRYEDIIHSDLSNNRKAINSFIVAIPIITFSWDIREGLEEMEYNHLLRSNVGNTDQKEKLVNAIKEGIAKFEY